MIASNQPLGHCRSGPWWRWRPSDRCSVSLGRQHDQRWRGDPTDASQRQMRDVSFHRARSTRSPRTRPGSNGQPPSPTAGWAHLYRVDAPWAGSPRRLCGEFDCSSGSFGRTGELPPEDFTLRIRHEAGIVPDDVVGPLLQALHDFSASTAQPRRDHLIPSSVIGNVGLHGVDAPSAVEGESSPVLPVADGFPSSGTRPPTPFHSARAAPVVSIGSQVRPDGGGGDARERSPPTSRNLHPAPAHALAYQRPSLIQDPGGAGGGLGRGRRRSAEHGRDSTGAHAWTWTTSRRR